MVTKKIWFILNISLSLVSLLLILTLFNVQLPTVGSAQYAFDSASELCIVEWKGEISQWDDIDRCCLEAKKQLSCEKEIFSTEFGTTTQHCSTGDSTVSFHLNQKAYNYCKGQSIW
jgi:hypothetical protein